MSGQLPELSPLSLQAPPASRWKVRRHPGAGAREHALGPVPLEKRLGRHRRRERLGARKLVQGRVQQVGLVDDDHYVTTPHAGRGGRRARAVAENGLRETELEFPPAGVALIGDNGAGKTNLLEGIVLEHA